VKNFYFQKLILNRDRPEGVICKTGGGGGGGGGGEEEEAGNFS
jgi:hypothetical protein